MNLKPFVNNKDLWVAFNEELDKRIDVAHKGLEQAEGEELYRYQGDVRTLKKLKQLRDYVNGRED